MPPDGKTEQQQQAQSPTTISLGRGISAEGGSGLLQKGETGAQSRREGLVEQYTDLSWRESLGLPKTSIEERQKRATAGEKPVSEEKKVSQEALEISKRAILRVALRPELWAKDGSSFSFFQQLLFPSLDKIWPTKENNNGQQVKKDWSSLDEQAKAQILDEIERQIDSIFENNPKRALVLGLKTLEAIRDQIAKGVQFKQILDVSSTQNLTEEQKKELDSLKDIPSVEGIMEIFGFQGCFRVTKNPDGTSTIVFDQAIFENMTYEEYVERFNSQALGQLTHPLLTKKTGYLWWRRDRPLEKNEFDELKAKILRKAELEGRLKAGEKQEIGIYKLVIVNSGVYPDTFSFIKEFLFLGKNDDLNILTSNKPEDAEKRAYALGVINGLIDDYVRVYNEVAEATEGKPISRGEVLRISSGQNRDLLYRIARLPEKPEDIISAMKKDTEDRLEKETSRSEALKFVRRINGEIARREEKKKEGVQQETEESEQDETQKIKQAIEKIKRLIRLGDENTGEIRKLKGLAIGELVQLVGLDLSKLGLSADNLLGLLTQTPPRFPQNYRSPRVQEIESRINTLNSSLSTLLDTIDGQLQSLLGEKKICYDQLLSHVKIPSLIITPKSSGNRQEEKREGIDISVIEVLQKQISIIDQQINELIQKRDQLIKEKEKEKERLEQEKRKASEPQEMLKEIMAILGIPENWANDSNFTHLSSYKSLLSERTRLEKELLQEGIMLENDQGWQQKLEELEGKLKTSSENILPQLYALRMAFGSDENNAWKREEEIKRRLEEIINGKTPEYNSEFWGNNGEKVGGPQGLKLVYILWGPDYLSPVEGGKSKEEIDRILSLFVSENQSIKIIGGLEIENLKIESGLISTLRNLWNKYFFRIEKIDLAQSPQTQPSSGGGTREDEV